MQAHWIKNLINGNQIIITFLTHSGRDLSAYYKWVCGSGKVCMGEQRVIQDHRRFEFDVGGVENGFYMVPPTKL